jgi:hypothetical protein
MNMLCVGHHGNCHDSSMSRVKPVTCAQDRSQRGPVSATQVKLLLLPLHSITALTSR